MTMTGQRAALERLIHERREDYSSLSRLLGRNPAYVQQFIKRGTPRKLSEEDRQTLARYFNVGEDVLGGPPPTQGEAPAAGLVPIPRFNINASAGPGTFDGSELPVAHLGFDAGWLRQLCKGRPDDLSIIRVQGDSMYPSLADGDDIMVDRSDAGERLHDGIYVLRRDDTLMVKRLAVHPASRRITISSDNGSYPTWADCEPSSIDIIGRVVWAGRKIS